MMDLSRRYDRNFSSLSPEEQARLSEARVAVIGLGGLGGGVCELLARTGVGHLTLIDGDRFDPTNLNRQLLSREDNLGQSKAEAAGARIRQINSSVTVSVRSVFLTRDNVRDEIRNTDLVVDCLDTIDARFLLQDGTRDLGLPLVSGAIAGASGQVTVIFPGDPGFDLIYGGHSRDREVNPNPDRTPDQPQDRSQNRGVETRLGNLSYCAALVAAIQASEAVKVLLGRGEALRNRLLIADLWTNTMEVMDLI